MVHNEKFQTKKPGVISKNILSRYASQLTNTRVVIYARTCLTCDTCRASNAECDERIDRAVCSFGHVLFARLVHGKVNADVWHDTLAIDTLLPYLVNWCKVRTQIDGHKPLYSPIMPSVLATFDIPSQIPL